MKVCILGNGLSSLSLAQCLVNQGLYVDFFSSKKKSINDKNRTIGISSSNVEFINKNILNINNLIWDIRAIEIYSEILENKKILDFENNNQILFSIVKNHELINKLEINLSKNRNFRFKNDIGSKILNKKEYKLIINCNKNHPITKKYFYKKINKDYDSYAFTTIINHKKISNNVATQVFTKNGPLAFLPISNSATSIVYSARRIKNINFEELINKYNFKYQNLEIGKTSSFKLVSLNLRNYYYKNILAFGDLLHRLHPLAGQGFNMTIRDIKELSKFIKLRIDCGLDLDNSICVDFENKTKHKNYIFSNGIDFIYEFFNFESKINQDILSKSVKFFGKHKSISTFFTKIADKGIIT